MSTVFSSAPASPSTSMARRFRVCRAISVSAPASSSMPVRPTSSSRPARSRGSSLGVEAARGVTMSQFARLRINTGFTGILLDGRVNAVENNDVAQNIFTRGSFDGGIVIRDGVDNTVRLNQASGIDGNGIVLLQGSGNKVLKNVVRGSENVSFGFSIVGGDRACVRWNQGVENTNPGISISGFEHTVRNNTFKLNVAGDCHVSDCLDCTVIQNSDSDGSCPNVVNPTTPSCP